MLGLRIKYRQYKEKLKRPLRRLRLRHTDFSIISNNCWSGTAVYIPFGLKYTTPTVGLFFMDEDYMRFISRLRWYLAQDLRFIPARQSRYYDHLSHHGERPLTYPVAVLGGDVEIHFLHYKTEQEAAEKWHRRLARINFDKLFVKMSIRDSGYDISQMLQKFKSLPYKNKLCFSPMPLSASDKEIVHVPELEQLNILGGDETDLTLKYIDIYDVLNTL